MKIAILGAGAVGRTLGRGLAGAQQQVRYAVRELHATRSLGTHELAFTLQRRP